MTAWTTAADSAARDRVAAPFVAASVAGSAATAAPAAVATGAAVVEGADRRQAPSARRFLDGVLHWRVEADGWLTVHGDRVWLTRSGDVDDHVLDDGQALAVRAGDDLVVEPWRRGGSATLQWRAGAAVAPA